MDDLNKRFLQLQETITKLKKENQFLKDLLDAAGISYEVST